jgi:hypothetical protein
MIKKILAWITGKSDTAVAEAAPYKVEVVTPKAEEIPLGTEATIIAVSHSDMPINALTVEVVPNAVVPAAIETSTVTVKAKYKKADLTAMTKAQLMELVTKHGVEVKARSTKEELVKVLVKV